MSGRLVTDIKTISEFWREILHFLAILTSEVEGSVSRDLLITTWGSCSMALSLMDEGLLSTLSECSAHLSLISCFSVRSLDPSIVSRGEEDPLLCGP